MNENVKKILSVLAGLIAIIFLFRDCSCSCGSNSLSTGKYEYTDAVGHEYSLILNKDGSATLRMTSSPKSEIDEIAYRSVREGVRGSWTRKSFLIGDGTRDYMDIYVDGENLMLCADGYIYSSFDAMTENRTSSGNRWRR